MLAEKQLIALALDQGFSSAAVLPVDQLVYVPAYRSYCEENLCGNYDRLPVCPPQCGTNEDMRARMLAYSQALVLQTEIIPEKWENQYYLAGKRAHNELMEKLLAGLDCPDCLVMSAGPWKNHSCMSAYSIDAEKMAASCGMTCWAKDGKLRFFSTLLFNP